MEGDAAAVHAAHMESGRLPEAALAGDFGSVAKRVLWLYGLYTLLHQSVFLIAYFALPEGFLKGTPWFGVAEWAAAGGTFSGQFVRTLCTNLGVVCALSVALNLQRVKEFSLGYFMPIWLGLFTGLFLGTNSLQGVDLRGQPFLAGTATGLTMGGAEMLGYILVIAATVKVGVYRRVTWLRWDERFVRVGRLRDVSLQPAEWTALIAGLGLLVLAAWRESY